MQLHFFPPRNGRGKTTLSFPAGFDWQGAAKEGKWFSKSDLRKTISCALTGLLLLQVLQEKQISWLLWFLIRVLLRSPSIADTTLPNRPRNSIHLLMHSPWRDYVSLWRTWEPLLFLFAETLWCTWKRHKEKKLYFWWGRVAGSWLPLFFFFLCHLKKLLGWLISDLDYHILPVIHCSLYWNF